MSVFRRKDGKIVIQFQKDNKKYTCYSKAGSKENFKTLAEAREYAPIFYTSVFNNNGEVKIYVNEDFLGDFYDWVEKKTKPSTFYGYRSTFEKYWKPLVVGLVVSEINNNQLESFANKLFRGRYNWQGKSAVGKLFAKYLRRLNPLIDPDVIMAPKKSKPHVKSYSIYTLDEFNKFFSVIEDREDQFLFLLLFRYGLRISECLGLMWTDFKSDGLHIDRCACIKNKEKGVIFTSPKTVNSIRVYPLLAEFVPYIEELRPKKGNPGMVFKSKSKDAIVQGQSSVRRKAQVYAEKAGVKVIKLHEFRHSCVSNLLASGLSVRVVSRWVGDAERMVQETYSHLLPSEKDVIKDFYDSMLKTTTVPDGE